MVDVVVVIHHWSGLDPVASAYPLERVAFETLFECRYLARKSDTRPHPPRHGADARGRGRGRGTPAGS